MSTFRESQSLIHQMNLAEHIAIGYVVNNDDPLQMGRVQVRCFAFDDDPDNDDALPWAYVASPNIGLTQYNEYDVTGNGTMQLHGIIATPAIGSIAIVAGISGNSHIRVCLGFICDEFAHDSFPNGAYVTNQGKMNGPSSSYGDMMEPLTTFANTAFGPWSSTNYERISRGYDRPAGAVNQQTKHNSKRDDPSPTDTLTINTEAGDVGIDQGYTNDPLMPGDISKTNNVYGWRTPAGHVVYMCDDVKSSRIKMTTIKGSQILLDDTNERIYINTSEGNNWIEMDFDGNVDVFSKANVSIRSAKNINLTADEKILFTAKQGIHLHSDTEIRTTSVLNTNMNVGTDLNITANNTYENVSNNKHSIITQSLVVKSNTINQIAQTVIIQGSDTSITTNSLRMGGSTVDITGSGGIKMTGGSIHLNGPSAAAPSSAADPTNPVNPVSFWTNRVPDHEPWPRRDFVTNNTNHLNYNITDINSEDIGKEYVDNLMLKSRNAFWRR